MPPSKQARKAPPRNGNAKAKASPYNKNAKNDSKNATSTTAKKSQPNVSRPIQARNKHQNVNLTSELDSLLGDLNSQLHRKKTKRDVRSNIGGAATGPSVAEKALEEAQAKHESLQNDMMSALDGISALGK